MARGRPRAFDRDEALMGAMLVFWRKSFNATSVRDLSDALGIGMTSLYASFGTKEDLFVEAAGLYMKVAREMWQVMDGLPPREAIEAVLRRTARELSSEAAHPTGCMLTAAFVDEDMPEPVAEAIRQARRDWSEVIADQLSRAVEEGSLPPDADISSLTRFYAGIVQSVGVQAHDGASPAELDRVIDVAMAAWPEAKAVSGRRSSAPC